MVHGVCVLGDTAVDLILRLHRSKEDGSIVVNRPHLYPGGSGANTAVALARLGIHTQFIGTVGHDDNGRIVIDDFKKEGVETSQLFIEPMLKTVYVLAFVYVDGERYLWGWPQEKQSFSSIDFQRIDLDKIKKAGWLHTTGLLLGRESSGRETTLSVLEWCRKNDVVTSLDLNLRVSKKGFGKHHYAAIRQAIEHSMYILGSEQEFSLLDKERDWKKAAAKLAQENKFVVVRRGVQGSVFIEKQQTIHAPAYMVKVVDTVGAGDVYNAGFIAALIKHRGIHLALQWANATSAFKVSKEGARASPTLKQLIRFMNNTKIRQGETVC